MSHLPAQQRAEFLAQRLWKEFVSEDYGQRVALTGAIVPHGSLKSSSLRRRFSFAESLGNKFVTLPVARRCVSHLEKKFFLQVPIIPGVTKQQWRESQARKIVRLCYRAKKNSKARANPKPSKPTKAMDDTLVYDGEARNTNAVVNQQC